jgi:hypothetical protein
MLSRFSDEDASIQRYARLAGVVGLVSIIAGGFGEAYAPGVMFAAGNPAATAQHILGNETLFRWGFTGYLIEAICDAILTMLFWVLVRPLSRNLAMLMVVFRIISTCGFASSEMLYFGTLSTLRDAHSITSLQSGYADALAYALFRISVFGGSLFSEFYGLANLVFGWLIYRSGYVPRVFGIGIILMGAGFALRTFLVILAPAYASELLLAIAGVTFIPFIIWLLVKGVDARALSRHAETGA